MAKKSTHTLSVGTQTTPKKSSPKNVSVETQTSPKKEKAESSNTSHPSTAVMVNSAIGNLKERGGSSLQAIKKYIASTFNIDIEKYAPFIRKYIKSAVTAGVLVQTTGTGASGSFKLASISAVKSVETTAANVKKVATSTKKAISLKAANAKSTKPGTKKAKAPAKSPKPGTSKAKAPAKSPKPGTSKAKAPAKSPTPGTSKIPLKPLRKRNNQL